MSLETSPNVTPEMVRRRVEAGSVDNNEISCHRRTSTPEIVRIRTTEAKASEVTASTREDASAAASIVHGGISESTKSSLGQSATTASASVDVVRHGMLGGAGTGRNSETLLVRKGCDQDSDGSRGGHRPASGAEVVRYKVEQLHQSPSSGGTGSLENNKKQSIIAAKQNNPILTSQYSSEKDKKQQMPLRHQVNKLIKSVILIKFLLQE